MPLRIKFTGVVGGVLHSDPPIYEVAPEGGGRTLTLNGKDLNLSAEDIGKIETAAAVEVEYEQWDWRNDGPVPQGQGYDLRGIKGISLKPL